MNCPIKIECYKSSQYQDMCFECMKKRILKAQEIIKKSFPDSNKKVAVAHVFDDNKPMEFSKSMNYRGRVSLGDMYVTEDTNEGVVYCGNGNFQTIGGAL